VAISIHVAREARSRHFELKLRFVSVAPLLRVDPFPPPSPSLNQQWKHR
jgi:hypothetical protein